MPQAPNSGPCSGMGSVSSREARRGSATGQMWMFFEAQRKTHNFGGSPPLGVALVSRETQRDTAKLWLARETNKESLSLGGSNSKFRRPLQNFGLLQQLHRAGQRKQQPQEAQGIAEPQPGHFQLHALPQKAGGAAFFLFWKARLFSRSFCQRHVKLFRYWFCWKSGGFFAHGWMRGMYKLL